VRFPDGSTEDVRLLGVDTPEVHTGTSPDEFEGIPASEAGRDWLRTWGHEASEFARAELDGETVTIRTDPTADRRGSYGRLLVYVRHEGADFNRALLERGYARLYDTTFDRAGSYAAAERAARSADAGLWAYEGTSATTATPTPVPDGGSSPDDLAVADVHADAPGDDHENENGEYVVFENTGDGALDLSGWTVRDAADHTYTFGDVTLAPGERVTLYTGSGADTGSEVYWGSDAAIWNNAGDTVVVEMRDGEVAVKHTYP
jgi:micrococcal nuclease